MGFIVNLASLFVGLIALLIALFGLVPFLGAINYIAIPVAIVGAGLGVLSGHRSGRNFSLFVLIVAVIRLFFGGGLI